MEGPEVRVGRETDSQELHQAWVLVELFLQSQVLQWSQLLVSEIRGRREK